MTDEWRNSLGDPKPARAGAATFQLHEVTEVEPHATKFEAIIESTRWDGPMEPVALSSYFLAQAIYPRVAELCARIGVYPFHETEAFRIFRQRPDGTITVTADYEYTGEERLRVAVGLSSSKGEVWQEGSLTFRLFKLAEGDLP